MRATPWTLALACLALCLQAQHAAAAWKAAPAPAPPPPPPAPVAPPSTLAQLQAQLITLQTSAGPLFRRGSTHAFAAAKYVAVIASSTATRLAERVPAALVRCCGSLARNHAAAAARAPSPAAAHAL
jgi:hypothetical protein